MTKINLIYQLLGYNLKKPNEANDNISLVDRLGLIPFIIEVDCI